MAQAARRIVDGEIDTSIVRRLMSRPLRVVAEPVLAEVEPVRTVDSASGYGVAPSRMAGLVAAPAAMSVERSGDVARLRTEVMVMKAVLGAERRESDRLRACITSMDEAQPLSPEAQAVRDRWAALVDTLLQAPR